MALTFFVVVFLSFIFLGLRCFRGSRRERPLVRVDGIQLAEALRIMKAYLSSDALFDCCKHVLELTVHHASGVTVSVIAMDSQLQCLDMVDFFTQTRALSSDSGFMKRWMNEFLGRPDLLYSRVFADLFQQFSEHTADDCWPQSHPGAGKRKDGFWLFNEHGLKDVAVILRGLPASLNVWPDHGARHTTALEVAEFLKKGIIICRSESGSVHLLLAGATPRILRIL